MSIKLSPSFAPVWGHCSGAVKASENIGRKDTDSMRDSHAVKWLFKTILIEYKRKYNKSFNVIADTYIGQKDDNNTIISNEIAEAAQLVIYDVIDHIESQYDYSCLHVDHKISIDYGQKYDNIYNIDCCIVHQEKIIIWLYKQGHKHVEVKDNFQLISYAKAIIDQTDCLSDEIKIDFRLVQPFCYQNSGTISTYECDNFLVENYFMRLVEKANEAITEPKLSSGKHCQICPAVGICNEAKESAYSLIDSFNEHYQIDEMSGQDMALERSILTDGLAIIKARLRAVDDELEYRIKNGYSDTGLALEAKLGYPAWTVSPKFANNITKLFGADILKTTAKTPLQATKMIEKENQSVFKKAIKSITKQSESLKLVEVEDAITHKVFGKKSSIPETH